MTTQQRQVHTNDWGFEIDETKTIHGVMEYEDGDCEPLCGAVLGEDSYETDFTPERPMNCNDCIREAKSRGWSILGQD